MQVMQVMQVTIKVEEGWSRLQQGIARVCRILEGKEMTMFSNLEYMELYTLTYNMCVQPRGYEYSQYLYMKYKDSLNEYLLYEVLPSIREKHDDLMLVELVKKWKNHLVMLRWLSRFFSYLDRYYVPRKSVLSLRDAGTSLFRETVFNEIKKEVMNIILNKIRRDREGDRIDRALLKSALDVFVELGENNEENVYENVFETLFLEDTAEYYSGKALNWIVEDSCPNYLLKVEESMEGEKHRLTHCFQSKSGYKILKTVHQELIQKHSNELLEKEDNGCFDLLRANQVEDLSRMYKLFSRNLKSLKEFAGMFKKYVNEEGMHLVQQAEEHFVEQAEGHRHNNDFVNEILELHEKCTKHVINCFSNDSFFYKALKEAFDAFCNKMVRGVSTAELLALYCDCILRKGGKERMNDETVEDTLEKVVQLLTYISDKDLFSEFYRKKFSRRLLFDRSANVDHERFILSKLKHQFGLQFTSKMEGMMTDVTLAQENQNQFLKYLNDNPTISRGIDFNVVVLTTGFWPNYKTTGLVLPADMVNCVEGFQEFYQTKTQHRKLTWAFSMGTCHVNGKFKSKTIELIVGTYQAVALLLFNSVDRVSYSEIQTQLNLSEEELVRVLQSLSCGKYKILNKIPNNGTVSSHDYFEFNSEFTDRMRRIKVTLPSVEERNKVVDDVDRDRTHQIDASIVRIMKSRKVLNHQKLVLECIEHLQRTFKPDLKVIKKRIGELINREYIERDKEDPSVYKYMA